MMYLSKFIIISLFQRRKPVIPSSVSIKAYLESFSQGRMTNNYQYVIIEHLSAISDILINMLLTVFII